MAFDFNGGKPSKPSNFQSPYGFGNEQNSSDSRGFSNAPKVRDQPNYPIEPSGPSYGYQSGPQKRKAPTQRAYRSNYYIPWRTIFTILGIIGIVVLLVVFSEEISYFIGQLLAWAILLAVAVLIVKWVLFGGRRR